jgi:uncharacterized protein
MTNLTYRSPKTEVKPSPIEGKGLFAKEAIATGEIVAIKGGRILSREQWKAAEPAMGSAEIQVSDDFFIAPEQPDEREGSILYINHSCEPNTALQGQIVFVAMRDVAAGEELTHDWATTDDLDYVITCGCGAPTCRGTITGKDWMKPELQVKYRGWFCWFLQRKMESCLRASKTTP